MHTLKLGPLKMHPSYQQKQCGVMSPYFVVVGED